MRNRRGGRSRLRYDAVLERREAGMTDSLRKTDRTTVTRHPERASYDREAAYAILDEGLVAHVGLDAGQGVMVVPMTYARVDDTLVLHGAAASRWMSAFDSGRPISVCVTLLDGLVLARSAFSHSMNYRSVVAFGIATPVTDPAAKARAFEALVEHLVPGRWEDCRQPDAREIAATTVLAMPIDEASVKIRSGPPVDAAKDAGLSCWAGQLPLAVRPGALVPDAETGSERPPPPYLESYRRGPR